MTLAGRSPFTGRWGAATDKGAVRRHNEDSLLASPPLFLVADGMGGHDAGDIASAMVVASFARFVEQPSVSEDEVRQAVTHARQSISEYFEPSGLSGGSTLTGIGVSSVDGEAAVVVVNIGDSRTYRLSQGVLEQLSKDHSTVQELIDSGAIQALEARTHPERNVITRAISPTADSEPDVWSVPARVGDRYLACSDGLTGELTDDEIRDVLLAHDDPQTAAAELVARALAERGRDNITAVVVDVVQIARGDDPGGLWQRLAAGSGDDASIEDTIPTHPAT
ncbi:protein phosphatase [Sanguibacter gelidistatuariae]|uniref:Protein phosphatase n=1 Tax=Sanguibacter gelidistatuariae TaxID=1814289 RepID=A0A1G6GR60_9MICO|nr:protein phosphatase 2C domain-containing protein [Sanguibacter gelidistatuariae]SDB84333.1 protein phosphatase [Sanguibacter gelidistatuariae]